MSRLAARFFLVWVCAGFALALLALAAQAGPPSVELEMATEPGFPITGAHDWSRALGELELGTVRIRAKRQGDRPRVTSRGSKLRPSYHVLGILSARNKLRIPSGAYGLGEMARLKRDLVRLGDAKEKESEKKVAWGLTASELQAVRTSLRGAVSFPTLGESPAEVVHRIALGVKLSVRYEAEAKRVLAEGEPVFDNVQKISSGTALAALLRPYGLMLVPRKGSGGEIALWIVRAKEGASAWPVGWPAEKKETELVPILLEFLNAEIDEFTLTETLTALQPRVKVPFLLDHNAMARHGLDPEKISIVILPKRTYYKSLLRKVLTQARMKSEVRVDESGKPLLWMTTVKR